MRIFVDDIRTPKTKGDWIIVRSYEEAIRIIKERGFPSFISFDHDLGMKNGGIAKSGYDLAKWIVNADIEKEIDIPVDFSFNVHSANPVGKKNIEDLLNRYLKFKFPQRGKR